MKGSGRRRSKPQQLSVDASHEGGATPNSDRRPLRFWQPFNDWWRSELERLGRRPNAQEILEWYQVHALVLWREDAPSLQETRVHAKCLRSLPLVRDYFRNYRAKKRSVSERSGSQAPGDDLCYPTERNYEGQQQHHHHEEDEEAGEDPEYRHLRVRHSLSHSLGQYGRRRGSSLSHHAGEPAHEGREAGVDGDADADAYAGGRDAADEEDGEDGDGSADRGAAAAAAGLTQLATLRPSGGSGAAAAAAAAAAASSGLPPVAELDLLHSALPRALSPPVGGALWAAAAQQHGGGAAGQQAEHELLRGLTLQQLHQQLALAALAQNLALAKNLGLGLSMQAVSAQQQAAVSQQQQQQAVSQQQQRTIVASVEEAGVVAEGRRSPPAAAGGAVGGGVASRGALALPDSPPLVYGRGKRTRRAGPRAGRGAGEETEYGAYTEEMGEAGGEVGAGPHVNSYHHARTGPSGRGAAASPVTPVRLRSPVAQSPAARRGACGAGDGAAAAKQSATKRRPANVPLFPAGTTRGGSPGLGGEPEMEAEGGGESEGELVVAPLRLLHVPAMLGLEPLPRAALAALSHEALVERVLVLQAHLQLGMAQQQQQQGPEQQQQHHHPGQHQQQHQQLRWRQQQHPQEDGSEAGQQRRLGWAGEARGISPVSLLPARLRAGVAMSLATTVVKDEPRSARAGFWAAGDDGSEEEEGTPAAGGRHPSYRLGSHPHLHRHPPAAETAEMELLTGRSGQLATEAPAPPAPGAAVAGATEDAPSSVDGSGLAVAVAAVLLKLQGGMPGRAGARAEGSSGSSGNRAAAAHGSDAMPEDGSEGVEGLVHPPGLVVG